MPYGNREEALALVRSLFPGKRAGVWTCSDNGDAGEGSEWRVEYRLHGRRRPEVEVYVNRLTGCAVDVNGAEVGS